MAHNTHRSQGKASDKHKSGQNEQCLHRCWLSFILRKQFVAGCLSEPHFLTGISRNLRKRSAK